MLLTTLKLHLCSRWMFYYCHIFHMYKYYKLHKEMLFSLKQSINLKKWKRRKYCSLFCLPRNLHLLPHMFPSFKNLVLHQLFFTAFQMYHIFSHVILVYSRMAISVCLLYSFLSWLDAEVLWSFTYLNHDILNWFSENQG